ncbi:MAG TPA: hypothetical protein ENN12_03480 [Epsilonproteobacteria bacterium]|nr:hypothetical protein [Campylobacterota bacterium]
MNKTTWLPLLHFLFLCGSTLSLGYGITNTETATSYEKKETLDLLETKERELNRQIDQLKAKLEERKEITKERYRLVAGIKILSRKTLIEKMEAYEKLKKVKKLLQIELDLQNIENLEKN